MKKDMRSLMLLAILLSCCACAAEAPAQETEATVASDATEATPEETQPEIFIPELEDVMAEYEAKKLEGQPTPEQLYGHINQLEPVDGVYKIWNAEGVKNMVNHPDGTFEFLCNVDMEGATLSPIGTADKPFTGEIRGINCTVSNFTIEGSVDGYLGFVTVNKGLIRNITFDKVTMIADENTKYMGGVAAVNETEILRATVNGTVTAEKAAEGAVYGSIAGLNTGRVINSVSDMDLTYTAEGSATIGGLLGVANGEHMEFSEAYGFLEITGTNKKVGLIIGEAKDISMYSVAFLGENNAVDGVLFENYFGSEENVTYEKLLTRDNKPFEMDENVAKLRDKVVKTMYEMATIRWTTTQNLYHDCHCQLTVCHGIYKPGMLHIGIPYNHYSTTLVRFKACLDENNFVKDWLYELPSMEGYDTYFGNDCSGAVQVAWWSVSSTSDVLVCANMQPSRPRYGTLPVGEWPSDIDVPDGGDSKELVIDKAELDVWYEAYAQVRRGDAYVHYGENGNHTRMAQEDPVIVRDENGKIDGDYSYIVTVEQGAPAIMDPYFCTWRYDYKYSFKNLILGGYLPITVKELVTGEMEPVDCKLVGGIEGKSGMVVGTIESNYNIETVTMVIKDSQGNVVMDHTLNPNAQYRSDLGSTDMGIRNKAENFNLAKFATPLAHVNLERGESYTYTVTVLLSPGDVITVKEGSFQNGTAQ